MRKSVSFIPVAVVLIAGSALAQTSPPAPDSSRISQRCTTTGLEPDASGRCPDDVVKDSVPIVLPQVLAPAPGGVGTGTTGAGNTGPAAVAPGTAAMPAPAGSVSGPTFAPRNIGGAAPSSR